MTHPPVIAVVSGSIGAYEWNMARTAHKRRTDDATQLPLPIDGAPPVIYAQAMPSTPSRVMARLQGMLVGADGLACTHDDDCHHRGNRIPYTKRQLARDVFGSDSGKGVRMVGEALSFLADSHEVLWMDPNTRQYSWRKGSLITLEEHGVLPEGVDRPEGSHNARGLAILNPILHESLLAGQYQLIPAELVRDTSKVSWQLWLAMLTQTPTGTQLSGADDYVEYAISGPNPSIPAQRIGLGGQRPDRLRASLAQAIDRGNKAQGAYRATLLDRVGEGLKVGLELRDPERVTSGRKARDFGTQSAGLQDVKRVTSGRDSCSRQALETYRDELETNKSINDDHSSSSRGNEKPLAAALKAAGWSGRSSKQVAQVRAIAQRRKLSDAEVADLIGSRYPGREHADLFRWLDEVKLSRPFRPLKTPCRSGCDGYFYSDEIVHNPEDRGVCRKCRAEAAA